MVHLEVYIGIEGDILLETQQHGDKGVPYCSMLALPRNPGHYLFPNAMHSVVPSTKAVGLGPIAVLPAQTRCQLHLSPGYREGQCVTFGCHYDYRSRSVHSTSRTDCEATW